MKEDIQFLKDLQNELKTQEHDTQAAPRFWSIMDYRTVPGNEEYDNGFEEYFYNDGDHVVFKRKSDLVEFLEEHFRDEIDTDDELKELISNSDMDELWDYVENNLNDCGYFSKVFAKEEEFIVPNTMFLTKAEAKQHLKVNHYHYSSKAHTYAVTAWRAPKVERLIKILEEFDWDKIIKFV